MAITSRNESRPLLEDKVPKDNGKIRNWTKFSFAVGAIPNQITHTVISFFMTPFLLTTVNLGAGATAFILFLGRGWDAISDPTVGYLVQITNTRFGSLKPWIVASTIPFCLSFIALWSVPRWEYKDRVLYVMVVYLLLQTFLTAFVVPYSALTVHLSNIPSERDKAVSWSMVFAVIGTIMGATIQGAITDAMVGDLSSSCKNCSDPSVNETLFWEDPLLQTPPKQSEDQLKVQSTFVIGGLVVALICFICAIFVTFGVPEQKKPKGKKGDRISVWEGIKTVFKTKSFVVLSMMILWAWMAVGIYSANLLLYADFVLENGSVGTSLITLLLLSTFFCIPVTLWLCQKYSKKRVYLWGLILLSISMAVNLFIPAGIHPVPLVLIEMITGACMAPIYLIPLSMLPEVVDEATVRDRSRREFGTGIAVSLATAALGSIGGYRDGCCEQPISLKYVLRVTQGPICAAFVVLSAIATLFYPLTEEMVQRNKDLVQEILDGSKDEEPIDGATNVKAEHLLSSDVDGDVTSSDI